ncbi:MAG: DUF2784 domain-containing protein [Elusimicrobia bacterium]|nr:DUF2784 domain-containing protein [Elusimicrobiota bacterium]
MKYGILADLVMAAHFAWILFILAGFFLTAAAFKYNRIFGWCFFRTIHLLGIAYVCLLAVFGKPCPLTLLENALAAKYGPDTVYPGSFLAYYIGKLVYPDIQPMMLIIPTVAIGIFTAAVFIFRPPSGKSRGPHTD